MRLPDNIDIHSHSGPVRQDAILCVDPTECMQLPDGEGYISVGIHPWNADKADAETWERMKVMLADPRVIAVGEAGLDRLRGPGEDVQEAVFLRQADIASSAGLPLVIHCVRAFDRLLKLRKNYTGQWIVHGFRGKPATARQLLAAGLDLSFGSKYNVEAYDLTPVGRRYRETD